MKSDDESCEADAVPEAARELAPLDRLRYEMELVQEDLTVLQMEQETAMARGGDAKGMVRLARQAAELRARHSRVRQEILRTERAQSGC